MRSIYEFKTIPKTRDQYNEGLSIRPVGHVIPKGSLENGNYVMYYDPIYDSKTHKFRDKVPYCFFSIVDEKPNGYALFFTHTGDTLAYGQYLDGVQNGKWIIKLPFSSVKNSININYSPLNLDGEVVFPNEVKEIEVGWSSYEIEFVRGFLDGPFHFKTNGVTRSVGKMQQNKPIGLWKLYYSNGNLANSFELREYPKMVSNNFVYLPIANNTCIDFSNAQSSVDCLPMGNNKSSLIGLNTDFFEKFVEQIRDSISSSDYDYSFDFFKLKPNEFEFHSFESSQKILFVNWFEMYHENGQLLFKMHFSESGELTHYSYLYDESGKIYVEIRMNKDRTKAIYKYRTDGKTKRITCRMRNGERICT